MRRRVCTAVAAAAAVAFLAACSSSANEAKTAPKPAASSSFAADPAGAIPTGFAIPIGGWKLAFAPTVRNATDAVKAADKANKAAPAGKQYVMVNVTAVNEGKAKANPADSLSFSFTGSDGVLYGLGQSQPCGVIPNDLLKIKNVPAGETVTGAVCQVVPSSAVNGGSWLAAAATGGMKLTFGLGG